jgi:hypothetical protein
LTRYDHSPFLEVFISRDDALDARQLRGLARALIAAADDLDQI